MSKAIRTKLRNTYADLRSHFGYHPRWWPGTPIEVTLTAVLVQQCDWSSAWRGVQRLAEEGLLSLPEIAQADQESVLRCIEGVAFGPTKSGRLIRFAQRLSQWGFAEIEPFLRSAETPSLRQRLLELEGIGQETADCILLYAGEHPSFVVDAYTRRAFSRLGRLPRVRDEFWSSPYVKLKEFFEGHLRSDLSLYEDFDLAPGIPRQVALFRDYHAQIVELGKHHCLKRDPRCRATGKSGWKDYAICETHCVSAANCTQCPLVASCALGSQSPS